jgi:uncharacterized alpha-E superfamily protein
MQPAPVLDLLLADEINPRSLMFQFAALADAVDRLPRNTSQPGYTPEQKLMLSALTSLRLANLNELSLIDAAGRRSHLAGFLTQLSGFTYRTIRFVDEDLPQSLPERRGI